MGHYWVRGRGREEGWPGAVSGGGGGTGGGDATGPGKGGGFRAAAWGEAGVWDRGGVAGGCGSECGLCRDATASARSTNDCCCAGREAGAGREADGDERRRM